jgi:uncharacterized protein YdcH (DUF465 family)
MPLQNHSLANEFPEMKDKIHQFKTSNSHFAKLFMEYDRVEHIVHRIESGAEAAADHRLEELKKQRLALKDQLFQILSSN